MVAEGFLSAAGFRPPIGPIVHRGRLDRPPQACYKRRFANQSDTPLSSPEETRKWRKAFDAA